MLTRSGLPFRVLYTSRIRIVTCALYLQSAETVAPMLNTSIFLDDVVSSSRVTRRLAVINVQPGAGTLQTALNGASAGDELVLADGSYTGSGTNVLEVDKSITIRALNAGQAVLDGENARRVVSITTGPVAVQGLNITRGSSGSVSTHACPNHLHVLHARLALLCGIQSPSKPMFLRFA